MTDDPFDKLTPSERLALLKKMGRELDAEAEQLRAKVLAEPDDTPQAIAYLEVRCDQALIYRQILEYLGEL